MLWGCCLEGKLASCRLSLLQRNRAHPGPAPADDPLPVHLSAVERGISNSTFGHMTLSMASYEASPSVSAFSSKFDAYLAGNATLTPMEQNGYTLFNGKAKCNQCHLSGTAVDTTSTQVAADVAPLFTDFTANNIGLPKNLAHHRRRRRRSAPPRPCRIRRPSVDF